MSSGHQRITWRRNIAENFNPVSRVHERCRQTTDRQTNRRQTDDRRQMDARGHITNMNMSSRSLKTAPFYFCYNFVKSSIILIIIGIYIA